MPKLIRQYSIFLVGLFVASLGVAFSTKAGLGTSPIASVPYVASLVNQTISFGWWLNILSVLQILVQIILLKKRSKPIELIVQLVVSFIYGYLTDFSCRLLDRLNPASYAAQLGLMLVGCIVLGLGIWIQYKGGVAMLPGEAMNRAISLVTGRRYENVKILFDILYILLSGTLSLIFLGKLAGVREGSIVAALLIGNIIKMYNRAFDRLTGRLHKDNH